MDLVGLKSTAVRPTNTAENEMARTTRLWMPRPDAAAPRCFPRGAPDRPEHLQDV